LILKKNHGFIQKDIWLQKTVVFQAGEAYYEWHIVLFWHEGFCMLRVFSTIALTLCMTSAWANQSTVELKQALPTTMEEVATVDILTEICPKLLDSSQVSAFNAGYERLITELLPNIPTPVVGIKTLHDDAEYKAQLETAREDAASVSVEENRQVCLDVLNYTGKK
jgi:hypothetical protein